MDCYFIQNEILFRADEYEKYRLRAKISTG